MKVFKIDGRLITPDDLSHQEMLEEFYILLSEKGFFFQGITKVEESNVDD